jgi:Flp pilus assembly protein TadD
MKAMKPAEEVRRRCWSCRRVVVPILALSSLGVLTVWAVMCPAVPVTLSHRVPEPATGREARTRLARELIDSGRGEEARIDLKREIATAGEDAELLDLLGRACLQSGHLEEAEASWRRVVVLDPERAVAWASLGRMALSRGEPAEAIELLERAERLDPESIPVVYSLMLASSRLGRVERTAHFRDRLENLKQRHGVPMTGMVGPDSMPEPR